MTEIPAPNQGTAIGTIDLALIQPPPVIETIDYEVLLRGMLTRLAENDPIFDEVLESDPAAKLLEVDAYYRMRDRQRVNEAARAVMLAKSVGTDLDHLGALWNVRRLQVGTTDQNKPIMETDERFRRRILLEAAGTGAAGSPGAYIFWALTLAPAATDASASMTAPGAVRVAILGAPANGQPPTEQVDAVRAAFADPWTAKRPLTDAVTVAPAEVVTYTIDADIWLLPGPDANLILDRSRAALTVLLAERRRLGMDMSRSALIDALHEPGVERVVLNAPAADVTVAMHQVALVSGTPALRIAGRAF